MTETLIVICVGILLPIIPAFILYKTLPAKTSVSGPFKGLNIQLGGAFGGYFLLVLVVFGYFFTKPETVKSVYDVWKIKGQIGFEQAESLPDLKNVLLSIRPSNQDAYPDGRFRMDILVKVNEAGLSEFPVLLIEEPGYEPVSIDLTDKTYPIGKQYEKEYDKGNKEVVIKTPILLKRM